MPDLITCDRPAPPRLYSAEIVFTISPRHAVLGTIELYAPAEFEIDARYVAQINTDLLEQANRQIIAGPTKSHWCEKARLESTILKTCSLSREHMNSAQLANIGTVPPTLTSMSSWKDRKGRAALRSFTAEDGKVWLEQNATKNSRWAKFARQGHEVAWEFEEGGGYSGRMLIDGEILTPAEATKKFLRKDAGPQSGD